MQCVALYAPDTSGVPGGEIPGLDKVAHALIFALPTYALIRAFGRVAPVAAAMVAQALVSEFLQGALLPHRSGDPLDVAADAVGLGLGAALATRAGRRGSGAPASGEGPGASGAAGGQ